MLCTGELNNNQRATSGPDQSVGCSPRSLAVPSRRARKVTQVFLAQSVHRCRSQKAGFDHLQGVRETHMFQAKDASGKTEGGREGGGGGVSSLEFLGLHHVPTDWCLASWPAGPSAWLVGRSVSRLVGWLAGSSFGQVGWCLGQTFGSSGGHRWQRSKDTA